MKLSRIYSSKLYLTSSRKDKIHAAIGDAKNGELVQQLSEYLDDGSKQKLKEAIEEKVESQQPDQKSIEPSEIEGPIDSDIPEENNVFSPSYSGGGSMSSGSFDDFGEDEGPDIFAEPESDEGSAEPDNPPADDAVEESTAIYGEVTADTQIEKNVSTLSEDAEVIKGTLNSREDTAGVIRLTIDDNELWLYYKDEVNIGDIMVDVIEVLNDTAYTYLSFSRLARSNNAIVFDINAVAEQVKSEETIEEENK